MSTTYTIPSAYDVYGNLLPPATYNVVSSFTVTPLDPDSPPYVLGIWVKTDDQIPISVESGETSTRILPIYLTQPQVDEMAAAAMPAG
jgi:hypothetical protein